MEQVHISRRQLFMLTFLFIVGSAFILLPGPFIAAAKQDAWLIPLWGAVWGILIASLWLYLMRLHPGLSIIQICRSVAGKTVGSVLALLFIWFFLYTSVWITRNISYVQLTLMPRTPLSVFHIMFLLIAYHAVIKGFEGIARMGELIMPLFLLFVMFVVLPLLKEWDWEQFQPVMQLDVWSTIKKTNTFFSFPFLEAVCFTMIIPFVKKKASLPFLAGIGLGGVFLSILIFFIIGIMGISRPSHLLFPIYTLATEVEIARFIEHIEVVLFVVYLGALYIQLSILYYCTVAGLCQLLKINNRAVVGFPFILIISGLALTYTDNIVIDIEWTDKYSFVHSSLYGVFLPILLILLTWLKAYRRKVRGGSK
ncbi:GerAB/ArcD/ProY family transporter [Paenibacillus wynnii]|uniref:Spore gernimation protein KC n=1 Tax=Paenibacillus wynnii TaxID=268407 RepID=A0A098MCA7_9BACL|nr:endospore germination permease [Paenibacillus wynnii]KGE19187.1 spore gernimation protein KC [Paenibacillus wynnii]